MHFLRWYYPDQVHGYDLSLASACGVTKRPDATIIVTNVGKHVIKMKKLLWEVNLLCPLIGCSKAVTWRYAERLL